MGLPPDPGLNRAKGLEIQPAQPALDGQEGNSLAA
jgi:hypothetical protein